MNCRNCNFELSGSEDYCPRCGVPLKLNEDETKESADIPPEKELPDLKPGAKSTIFDSEPIYIYSSQEAPQKPQKKEKKASGITTAFIVLFVLCVFGAGAFVAAEYLGIVPAVSFDFRGSTTEYQSTGSTQYPVSYNDSDGIVPPDVSYKPSLCFVCTQSGLSLRKGPDDTYAQTDLLSHGVQVQIIGGSITNKDRVYVYVPDSDSYGWLCSSFLTANQTVSPDFTEATDTDVSESTDALETTS